MRHTIESIETSLFTRQIKQLASDGDLEALQKQLIGDPGLSDFTRDIDRLRKIRMAADSQGKSDGVRVIYFLVIREITYLVLACPKHTKESLNAAEKNELKKLIRRLKNEV